MTQEIDCNVVTDCAIPEDMNGKSIRSYREKLRMSVQDFLFDLFKITDERFSIGHYSQVENEKRPVTERLKKALRTYKEKIK